MRPPPSDPYAEFGGGTATATAPPAQQQSSDPYAAFGGAAAGGAATGKEPPPPSMLDRLGNVYDRLGNMVSAAGNAIMPDKPAPMGGGEQYDPRAALAAGRNPTVEAAKREWEQVKGATKSLIHTGAGLVDLANRPIIPTATGQEFAVPELRHLTDAVRARTPIKTPDQEQGEFVESALEFLPLMDVEGPAVAKNLVEKFGVGADLAKFAQKYPKLAAAWNVMMAGSKTASRAAAEQGGQTYIKTGGDIEATKEAATNAAVTSFVLGVGGATAGETGKAIQKSRAGTRSVAGATFETHPKTGKLVLRNLEDVIQDPATQAVDEAVGNIARTGVANSLNRSISERPTATPTIPPSRQLPAPAGRAQGFTVGTTPPREVGTPPQTSTVTEQTGNRTVQNPNYEAPAGTLTTEPGQTVEQAAEQIGTQATATPPRVITGPGSVDTRNPAQQRLDAAQGRVPTRSVTGPETVQEPVVQQRPVITQEGTQTMGGGGPLILTADGNVSSVEKARAELAIRDRILNTPSIVDQMPVRQHQQLLAEHADLTEQLRRYDDFAASQPHFARPNVLEAVRNTNSLGDASEQLKAAHSPVWDAADKASGGEWTNLREREKWLRKKLNSDNPIGNYDDLAAELKQNQQDQMNFFEKYRTTLSPEEARTAINGYQDGIVLGNLDDMLQRKFGGISRELEQRGLATGNKRQRVFQPSANFNQQLEDFYNTGTNRDVLQRTIGQDHMDSLHDLGLMFNSTERMQQMQGLTKTILTSILHHYHGVRGMLAAGGGAAVLGATLGAREAGIAGVPLITGTASGVNRYITDRLITDPSFLKTFSYAMEQGIPPRTAGPLLAARIISTLQNQPVRQQKKEPTQ